MRFSRQDLAPFAAIAALTLVVLLTGHWAQRRWAPSRPPQTLAKTLAFWLLLILGSWAMVEYFGRR